MNASRVLVASTVVTILLGLGVLEVMSQKVRVDQPATVASDLGEAPTHSWRSSLSAQDDPLDVELGETAGWETETVHFVETEEP